MDTQIFLNNFGAIAQAPDGIDRLRELIVGLAMCGRLLPQNPADGRGAEMLQLAEREREELVSLGVVQRATTVPPVDADDVPFELPKAWEWARLDRCALYNNRAKVKPQEISDDSWVLDLEDIEKRSSTLLQRVKHVERKSKATKTSFRAGDVLYGKLRPYLDKVIVADSPGYCTPEIVPVTPLGGIDPYWLRWCMKRPDFVQLVEDLSYGVKMPRLGTDDAKESLHPIPPLAEQHRIVAKVDELMALCDELETQQQTRQQTTTRFRSSALDSLVNAESDDELRTAWQRVQENWSAVAGTTGAVVSLREAVLELAVHGKLVPQNSSPEPASVFHARAREESLARVEARLTKRSKDSADYERDPVDLPSGWVWAPLQDLVQFIDYRGKTPAKVDGGIPLITAKNVRPGFINREPREYVSPETYEAWMTRGIPTPGDVLFTTEAPMGNAALVDIEESFALAQRTICFTPYSDLHTGFLMYLLLSPWFQRELVHRATGMTATGIKAAKLRLIRVPVPPVDEQHLIAATAGRLLKRCGELDKAILDRESIAGRMAGAMTADLAS